MLVLFVFKASSIYEHGSSREEILRLAYVTTSQKATPCACRPSFLFAVGDAYDVVLSYARLRKTIVSSKM